MRLLDKFSNPNDKEHQPESGATGQSQPVPEDVLIIVPVRNMVLFPGVVAPVGLGREGSINAIAEAARSGRKVGFLLQHDADEDNPEPSDLHTVGTMARVHRYVTTQDGSRHAVVQGESRFRVLDFLPGFPFLVARIEPIVEREHLDTEVEARMKYLRSQANEALQLLPQQVPAEMYGALQAVDSPGMLADLIAGFLDIKPADKQAILQTLDVNQRLEKVAELLNHQMEVLKISKRIDQQTRSSLDERQREAVLREQMRTIQRELGEEDSDADITTLAEALDNAQLSEEADKEARKELKRLARTPEASAEYGMIRAYIEWLSELPWSRLSEEAIDIKHARAVLDADHYGLPKIKKRILEYLAVRKLNPEGRSPILCFVGPPGVGKTSLGKSIARSLGLAFVRASLGGLHDEAEIRGHRRTYIGALPGVIIQHLKKAGTRNPVFMLDEMDKLGQGSFHGDPASALLEVLDPEQNSSFKDNYLGVPFDLSKVLFIATANNLETIPGPLRDRMEIIELPGYTEDEKVQIARRYLVDRQLIANGLQAEQSTLSDAALHAIVNDYTREAGCRNLERTIGAVLRNTAVRITEGETDRVEVDADDLPGILGPRRFESEVGLRTSLPGVATGLAWTPVGGDILFIETARSPGKGRLTLTGQLGDVMKESAQAALSLLKARASSLGIDRAVFESDDIHLHVPAGATPKDGPSAGVAMFVSLASQLTEQKVRADIAMTGEISLRGLVLPVGGIKEKTLAALRAGIHTVMLPRRNQKDLEDIPANAREQLTFIWLDTVDDALAAVFENEATPT